MPTYSHTVKQYRSCASTVAYMLAFYVIKLQYIYNGTA